MNTNGFSLLELLVTVLLASIILSLGVPSLAATLAKSRQTAEIKCILGLFFSFGIFFLYFLGLRLF